MQTVILNSIVYILGAYFMGFFSAVPIGISQLEIAKRSLKGFLLSAMMIGIGTTLSDGIYGALAIFGIAPFLKEPNIIAVFRAINSVILIVLGIWAIVSSRNKSSKEDLHQTVLNKNSVSFITGFSLALTNPMIMVWWLIGLNFMTSLGLIDSNNKIYTIIFLASGIAGILSYSLLLSFSVYKSKKFFSDEGISKITRVLGYALLCLALYFAYFSASAYLNIK